MLPRRWKIELEQLAVFSSAFYVVCRDKKWRHLLHILPRVFLDIFSTKIFVGGRLRRRRFFVRSHKNECLSVKSCLHYSISLVERQRISASSAVTVVVGR